MFSFFLRVSGIKGQLTILLVFILFINAINGMGCGNIVLLLGDYTWEHTVHLKTVPLL